MRIIVLWGQIENTPGTMVDGQPQRYYFDKLDHAIAQAEDAGFHVYLTLSGITDFECNPAYNPNMRACTSGPTGIDPVPEQFGEFAAAVAGRYKDRVTAYGIWNEPNNGTFLRAGAEGRHNPVHVLYRKLYLAAYNRIKRDSNPDDAFGYKGARVYIGELSHLTRSVRVIPTSKKRSSFSALRFLRDVVERHPDSDALIRTQGVAWHPYQHTGQPDRRGRNGVVGIGRADDIQDLLDRLAERTGQNREGPRLLVTPKAKRPMLFFTEFGYFNGPYGSGRARRDNPDCPRNNCGPDYYKTEAGRADYYRRALRRAYFQDARWMVIYQATEISPQNYADARNSSVPPPQPPVTPDQAYIPEYGLFSAEGEVTGTRSYGKGAGRNVTDNAHSRRAFCTIYDWTAGRGYGVGPDPCGGTG